MTLIFRIDDNNKNISIFGFFCHFVLVHLYWAQSDYRLCVCLLALDVDYLSGVGTGILHTSNMYVVCVFNSNFSSSLYESIIVEV